MSAFKTAKITCDDYGYGEPGECADEYETGSDSIPEVRAAARRNGWVTGRTGSVLGRVDLCPIHARREDDDVIDDRRVFR